MRKKIFIFATFLISAAVLAFWGRIFIDTKNYFSSAMAEVLKVPIDFVGDVFVRESEDSEFQKLTHENERLKAQLLAISKNPYSIDLKGREVLVAKVYSTYPFNNRNLVAINAGIKDGLKESFAVTADGAVFLGAIAEVFNNSSIIRTIFDAGWELPVKISSDDVDALLIGGREPRLTLIVKDREVELGDSVYTASKNFPYGLKIGEVKDIIDEPGGSFKEASMSFSYEINDLTDVFILIQ